MRDQQFQLEKPIIMEDMGFYQMLWPLSFQEIDGK
jgi:hypothetical protein